MKLEKSKMIEGGWPGDKVVRKPRMDSLVNPSVKYPSINESIEIICLDPSGNLVVE